MHPITPFITEELWAKLGEEQTIMYAPWPVVDKSLLNEPVEAQVQSLIEVIKAVRNIRAEMNVPVSKKASIIVVAKTPHMKQAVQAGSQYIKALANIEHIELVDKLADKPRDASYAVVTGAEIYIPLANLIDLSQEIKRLEKELATLEQEVDRVKKKLMNQSFVEKAPKEVIDGEKAKEKMYSEKRKIIAEQLAGLKQK
jgi:valyl-tRNA synthetase